VLKCYCTSIRLLQAVRPQPKLYSALGPVVLLRPKRDAIVDLQPTDARRKDNALRITSAQNRVQKQTHNRRVRTAPAAARIDCPTSAMLLAAPGPDSGSTVPASTNTWPKIPTLRSVSCGSCDGEAGHAKAVRHTCALAIANCSCVPQTSRPPRWSTASRHRARRATARGNRLRFPGCCRPAAVHLRGPPPWCKSLGASRCRPGRSGRCVETGLDDGQCNKLQAQCRMAIPDVCCRAPSTG